MSNVFEKYRQTIKVYTRTQAGVDDFNEPTYSWTENTVSNVLVKSNMSEDIPKTSTRQEGHKKTFKLYIPATCTLDFENAQVELKGERYGVVGDPEEYPAVPDVLNEWNRIVRVEITHG